MRSPKTLLLSSSGTSRIVAAWTILIAVGLIVVLRLNWTTWTHYYQGGDEPTHELQIGVEVGLVVAGFFTWCGGLVVIAVVREVLGRRRGQGLAAMPNGRDSVPPRRSLPNAGPSGPHNGWPV